MPSYSRKNQKEVPDGLKPFTFHGLVFQVAGNNQGLAECPFCNKKKLYVPKAEPKGKCHSCGWGGNHVTFIRKLWEESEGVATAAQYGALAEERGLLSPETLKAWGVRKSKAEDTWIVPAYNGSWELVNLYRYVRVEGKYRLLGTPGVGHGLFGPSKRPKKHARVYLNEGPWDGMAWQEGLYGVKRTDDGNLVPSSSKGSLGESSLVVAVPGAGAWADNWEKLLGGGEVCMLYDNDHPDKQGRSAGLEGMKAAAGKLAFADSPPEGVWYLKWGGEGHAPELPSGHDVRDVLAAAGNTPSERLPAVAWVLDRLEPVPDEWVPAERPKKSVPGRIPPLPCNDWKTLVNQWRKAMSWPASGTGLDHGLACGLATCLSTMQAGDQLWMKLIGPAACGKTTLAEAFGVAKEYTLPVSVIRGFHSGYVEEKGAKEDNSLIKKANTKTMITKDGDTLMKSGNIEQILSEARDIYDRSARAIYRNKVDRQYEDVSISWILCGTGSLVALDRSELGERFLNVVVMDSIDLKREEEVLFRVALGVVRNIDKDVRQDGGQDDVEKIRAKQLTGGYVVYLRENAARLLDKVKANVSDDVIRRITEYGRFVACLRARPSRAQTEVVERELGTRLTSQLMRLALCLAVVLNEPTITPAVLRRVERVAIDTARGSTREIVADLYYKGREGAVPGAVAVRTARRTHEVRELLEFLAQIRVVEQFKPELGAGVKSSVVRWRLTEWFAALYGRVTGEEGVG